MVDIRLDEDWQLTRAANGDAPLASGEEEFLQSIRLESMTQEGDLFYDPAYGWSLLDFLHRTDEELTRIEIQERIRDKMAKRPEVDISSLQTQVYFSDDELRIDILFRRTDGDETYQLGIVLDRIRVEVIDDD